MAIIKQEYNIVGMRQDNLVATNSSNKYAHEIMNMRLNTIGDYTSASWTTEMGTLGKEIHWNSFVPKDFNIAKATPLGQAVINEQWVIFLTSVMEDKDFIIKLYYDNSDNIIGEILYYGPLGFSVDRPIETLTYYENDKIQKVYWTDGLNQPRVINICKVKKKTGLPHQFDFIQEVSLKENVSIKKKKSSGGLFPPGTVKYVITYFNEYGQETNIIYDSPLYYPTLGTRGCSPEENSTDSFVIKVSNLDTAHEFDYIRLYSIVRTTNNTTPICRIVDEQKIDGKTSITFNDTNTNGAIIDPTIISYLGGRNIVAQTINQKDNTLFLGNIKLATKAVGDILKLSNKTIRFVPLKKIKISDTNQFYPWVNQLDTGNSYIIKNFKYGEIYRFGIQFQDNLGNWSEVLHIADKECDVHPTISQNSSLEDFATMPVLEYTLLNSDIDILRKNGYRKARLVCSYPKRANRRWLYQGVINPTIYNKKERESHCPDNMASWFFRTCVKDEILDNVYNFNDNHAAVDDEKTPLPWRHDESLFSTYRKTPTGHSGAYNANNREIMSMCWAITEGDVNKIDDSVYSVDWDVMTLNSPDIELDENALTIPLQGLSMDIIGGLPITSFCSKHKILDAGEPILTFDGIRGLGYIDDSHIHYGVGSHDIHCAYWNDSSAYTNVTGVLPTDYPIYVFHRKGVLNNYCKSETWELNDPNPTWTVDEKIAGAKLNSKIFANIMVSKHPKFNNPVPINASDLNYFDSLEVLPTRLTNSNKIYYGNVNTIAPMSTPYTSGNHLEYPGESIFHLGAGSSEHIVDHKGLYFVLPYFKYLSAYAKSRIGTVVSADAEGWSSDRWKFLNESISVGSEPVPITYKSTKHLVFKNNNHVGNIGEHYDPSYSERLNDYLYLADVYNRNVVWDNPSEVDQYYPCGTAADLDDVDILSPDTFRVYGEEGDAYFQRYDCLKTYSFANDDVNQIVEICSFMCESRINLDGRYDKNRGLIDNTYISNTNYNKINMSYTQDNNFFSYHTLDDLSTTLDTFINQITWTKTKVPSEKVDTWTNITLASTADADGGLGNITKIESLNNNLFLFQEHGVALIGYNEKTAISVENGVPLELANSEKFTGFTYMSNSIGCQNKWSISNTNNGLFFIDDSRREILYLDQTFKPLSTENGFDAFLINNIPNNFIKWRPAKPVNFITFYDKTGNDIYYINDKYCLAWNEIAQGFTSFYSYTGALLMANIQNHLLIWRTDAKDKNYTIWAAREGDKTCEFFGEDKPYWITLACDGTNEKLNIFKTDKVFNTIEYSADVFDINDIGTQINLPVFNKIAAWTGYQVYKEFDINSVRKFNIWRSVLPRASYNIDGTIQITRDRIRNTFCYIKLINDNVRDTVKYKRSIIHNFTTYFDIK